MLTGGQASKPTNIHTDTQKRKQTHNSTSKSPVLLMSEKEKVGGHVLSLFHTVIQRRSKNHQSS